MYKRQTFDAYAQAVPNSQVGTVIKKAQTIELTIDAPEPFYVGGNIFLLRVGNSIFSKYNQTDVDGKGKLTYLIPLSDYGKSVSYTHLDVYKRQSIHSFLSIPDVTGSYTFR